jgi:antitoxin (DNA-binding transcriptional repressor) of toxin-antitoxin stability system
MKTVTKQEAVRGFEVIGNLAHAGETVIVTRDGKPWIKLVPALAKNSGKTAAAFRARLNRISPKPISGASGVLARLRR